jgi:O-antigen biosynthesis protein
MNTDGLLAQLRRNSAAGPHYVAEEDAQVAPDQPVVRLIAFYLPQFHPIPENDRWWGKGFTEWTNVTKAMPQFSGHYQPRLPQDLGFYDLRLVDTLRRQVALARRHGIHGFCFHTYWFGGTWLLDTPLQLLLANRDIDLPFCLCWANENWTRRWDGLDREILIAQRHSAEDDLALARALEPALRDPRYIRIDGRPILMVYRPGLLPNSLSTARRWRGHFARTGLGDPFLLMAQGFGDEDPRLHGFDAAVEFPPHKLAENAPVINHNVTLFNPDYQGNIIEYDLLVRRASEVGPTPYQLFRAVTPGWDNEARQPGRGTTFAFSTPEKYASWLTMACRQAAVQPEPDRRVVFINAWNEWAEGAHLEPDRHHGHAYLDATARVLANLDSACSPDLTEGGPRLAIVSHDARGVVQ